MSDFPRLDSALEKDSRVIPSSEAMSVFSNGRDCSVRRALALREGQDVGSDSLGRIPQLEILDLPDHASKSCGKASDQRPNDCSASTAARNAAA